MKHGSPFKVDPKVDEELEREGLTQEPAPLPWRDAELKYLSNALGLAGGLVAPQFQPPAQGGNQ
jgi:hypothetical protein